jgi:hypothetical protein
MLNQLQFLIYNTPQENVKIDVVVKDENIRNFCCLQKTISI